MNYPNNAACTWKIIGGPGKEITIVFLDFVLEDDMFCENDVLRVYEGSGTDEKMILE